jgi:hypothetical protein
LGKCPNRRGHFGSIGLIPTQLASDRQNLHGRYVLLILNASFDNASGAHPRSKQSNCGSEASGGGFQSRKSFRSNREDHLLIGLEHAMYSELRIDINQEVDMRSGMTTVSSKMLPVCPATSATTCLSRQSALLTSTWRRYFGQKTTWYLHKKTMLRFDL